MGLFNFLRKKASYAIPCIDPNIGKTVIRFTTHGCQAVIHEFDYIGTIVETIINDKKLMFSEHGWHKTYRVKVLKDGKGGSIKDRNLRREYEIVPSWYLIEYSKNLFVAYD